jgi:hypothetical protein
MGRICSTHDDDGTCEQKFSSESDGKVLKRTWVDNKMDIKFIGF